jgi:uncharacterized membrane protein required for colicin V production
MLIVGSLGAIVGFSWSAKDYVAAAVVGVMAMSGLWGYYFGAMRILSPAGGLLAAYYVAPPTGSWIAARLQGSVSMSPSHTQIMSLIGAALAVVFIFSALAKVLSRRWSEHSGCFESGNQSLGFGLGAAQGFVGVFMLLSAAVTMAPVADERLEQAANKGQEALARAVAQQIVRIAEQTQHSTLAPLIARYNPFEHIPHLKQMKHSVAAIQDPQVFARIAEHPALTRLQEKPSVRAALETLANDPELREIAVSGKAMTGETAWSLLDNPAIANLLTQPELLRDIAQAIGEIDQNELKSLTASAAPPAAKRCSKPCPKLRAKPCAVGKPKCALKD